MNWLPREFYVISENKWSYICDLYLGSVFSDLTEFHEIFAKISENSVLWNVEIEEYEIGG